MNNKDKNLFENINREIKERKEDKREINYLISSNMTEIIVGVILTFWVVGLIILIPAISKRSKLTEELYNLKREIETLEEKREQLFLK